MINDPSFDPFAEMKAAEAQPSDRVLSALRKEMVELPEQRRASWLAGASRTRRALLSLLGIFIILIAGTAKALPDSPWLLIGVATIYALLCSLFLISGLIPGQSGALNRSWRRALAVAAPPLLLLYLGGSAHHFAAQSTFSLLGLRMLGACLVHSSAIGLVSSLMLLSIWKKSDPFSPGLSGALLGLFGALVGTLSVQIRCASTEGVHLTIGHGLIAVLLASIGYFVGRRWMTP